MAEELIITPKTKVLQLIEAYPQLEEVLIGYVPAFKKLKNPVLRKTVAKVATLQQAAIVGNVNVEDLINRLRKEVGQEIITASGSNNYNTEKPEWFIETKIALELDAKVLLAAGEQPVNQAIADLQSLPTDKIYKLIAPFLPAPLVDKATSLGFSHWIKKENEELYLVYFYKK